MDGVLRKHPDSTLRVCRTAWMVQQKSNAED
jgi:hypothetical protein